MNNKQKVNLSNKEEFISIIGENTKKTTLFINICMVCLFQINLLHSLV